MGIYFIGLLLIWPLGYVESQGCQVINGMTNQPLIPEDNSEINVTETAYGPVANFRFEGGIGEITFQKNYYCAEEIFTASVAGATVTVNYTEPGDKTFFDSGKVASAAYILILAIKCDDGSSSSFPILFMLQDANNNAPEVNLGSITVDVPASLKAGESLMPYYSEAILAYDADLNDETNGKVEFSLDSVADYDISTKETSAHGKKVYLPDIKLRKDALLYNSEVTSVITVTAKDLGETPSSAASLTFNITFLTPENLLPPVFEATYYQFEIPDPEFTGDLATVSAKDGDKLYSVKYELEDPKGLQGLTVDSSSGVVSMASPLDSTLLGTKGIVVLVKATELVPDSVTPKSSLVPVFLLLPDPIQTTTTAEPTTACECTVPTCPTEPEITCPTPTPCEFTTQPDCPTCPTTTSDPSECPVVTCPDSTSTSSGDCPTTLSTCPDCPTSTFPGECPTTTLQPCSSTCPDCPATLPPTSCPLTCPPITECPLVCPDTTTPMGLETCPPPTECPITCPTMTATDCPAVCPDTTTPIGSATCPPSTDCPLVCPDTTTTIGSVTCPPPTECPVTCPTTPTTTDCPVVCPDITTPIGSVTCPPPTECPVICPTTPTTTDCPVVCPDITTPIGSVTCPPPTECPVTCPATPTTTDCPVVCPDTTTPIGWTTCPPVTECSNGTTTCPVTECPNPCPTTTTCPVTTCEPCSSGSTTTAMTTTVPTPFVQFERQSYSGEVIENVPIYNVLSVRATHTGGALVVYSLDFAGGSALGKFSITPATGVISTTQPLPYEEKYVFFVVATAGGSSDRASLFIQVVPGVNCGDPLFGEVLFLGDLPEEKEVANFAQVFVANPTNVDYVIAGVYPNEYEIGYFTINSLTGYVSCIQKIDFEKVHEVRITVDARTKSLERKTEFSRATLLVRVQDINDNAPEFTTTPAIVGYASGAGYDDSVPLQVFKFKAIDKDSGENAEIIYSVATDNFYIDENEGVLFAKREAISCGVAGCVVEVTATDKGTPSKSTKHSVNVKFISDDYLSVLTVKGQGTTLITPEAIVTELISKLGYQVTLVNAYPTGGVTRIAAANQLLLSLYAYKTADELITRQDFGTDFDAISTSITSFEKVGEIRQPDHGAEVSASNEDLLAATIALSIVLGLVVMGAAGGFLYLFKGDVLRRSSSTDRLESEGEDSTISTTSEEIAVAIMPRIDEKKLGVSTLSETKPRQPIKDIGTPVPDVTPVIKVEPEVSRVVEEKPAPDPPVSDAVQVSNIDDDDDEDEDDAEEYKPESPKPAKSAIKNSLEEDEGKERKVGVRFGAENEVFEIPERPDASSSNDFDEDEEL